MPRHHGSIAQAGKVRNCTPTVARTSTNEATTARVANRKKFNKLLVADRSKKKYRPNAQ